MNSGILWKIGMYPVIDFIGSATKVQPCFLLNKALRSNRDMTVSVLTCAQVSRFCSYSGYGIYTEHEKPGYSYHVYVIIIVSKFLIILLYLDYSLSQPPCSEPKKNIEKPGSGVHMQHYPVCYWRTPGSISSFLKPG